MVEDGGIIVLGGLISDEVRESKSQVPFLGAIPILGELLQDAQRRQGQDQPDGVHPPAHPARRRRCGDRKQRQVQLHPRPAAGGKNKGQVPLMPGERQPTLPALEQLVPPSC